MRIGIKYCGGCNESYRRDRIEEVLKREFKDFQFSYSNCADLLICISGCKKGCSAEKASGNLIHFDEWVGEERIIKDVKAKLSELLRS
uniref:Uncharacterized protein n=1 Tax=Archaeoglobus fulgidus TaxID=2234 RepID=A0A7J2THP0_ARCFL